MLKKKAIWIGTLSLAAVGLLLPQWADASSSEEGPPTVSLEKQYDEAHTDGHGFGHPFKKHVMKEEFQALLDEGYSKKEIMKASMISNASDTKIEEVLKNFKESGSWSKTAEHYGVNLEKYMKRGGHKALDKNFDKEQFKALEDEGYSRQEIFQAAHVARLADKEIEEVLKNYKETGSWTKTAEHFGVDAAELEKHKAKWEERKQQMEAHKGEILTYLSQYTGKNVKDLEGYLNDDIHLPHLIGAAVISHVSEKDLSEVIKYKKEEHSRKEFAAQFNIDKKEFMDEMKKVRTDIQAIIKK